MDGDPSRVKVSKVLPPAGALRMRRRRMARGLVGESHEGVSYGRKRDYGIRKEDGGERYEGGEEGKLARKKQIL